jgi:hypothetical protein
VVLRPVVLRPVVLRLALMRPVALTPLGMLAGYKFVFVCVFLSVWCVVSDSIICSACGSQPPTPPTPSSDDWLCCVPHRNVTLAMRSHRNATLVAL